MAEESAHLLDNAVAMKVGAAKIALR